MSGPEVYQLAQAPVTAHSFSPDREQVAVSLNSNEVTIFSRRGGSWDSTETLPDHDKLVTSIDWAPNTNRIVTCSQDRNAYVWTQVPDPQQGNALIWKPTLVLLRINRAATFVRWSPKEDKFAVASGARAIAVCSFDADNDWWVSKLLKKPIRSTVLSIDWHPNNVLLAAGSADFKARVFSAYVKDVDKKPAASVWGEKLPFNTVCGEYSSTSGGWVHTVGFSPSGDVLAFASHDSSITIVYPGPTPTIISLKMYSLPYVTLTWVSEQSIISAGHDCQPMLFALTGDENQWRLIGSLDDSASTPMPSSPMRSSTLGPRGGGGGGASGIGRLNNEAFNRFKSADSRGGVSSPSLLQAQMTGSASPVSAVSGSGSASGGITEMMTVHQNTIISVRPYEFGQGGNVARVSTAGVDGKLVVWPVDFAAAAANGAGAAGGLASKLGGLSIRR
ncbi:hypothetical protein FRB94_013042 [Tulasnella sp. JGI-2019a]|nr:hypothetical protein FRB93_001878 [Tulasnella sp. JGI-2019a]KAG9008635.1 hypothetical protein FRB94_013042 [Tulasnella sp. JGI-2019a]KAG9033826.1 hypothetical protein FRB95_014148 [Tulasnella sp. JGI-2019a]